ncbi:MAG: helix-turn-helix transcriptional regulator [Candidatus Hydrothermarchaeales archaeon]
MELKSMTENERLFSSVLLIFIVYFAMTSLISLVIEEEDLLLMNFRWTISFLISMVAGVGFFIYTRPTAKGIEQQRDARERNLAILKRALSEDEIRLMDIINNSEGVTQDSIRFKTGFSKSKVSALITELESKDIITREKMGRTYRLYIADWLKKA